jgi:hypothetical protein
MFDVLPPSPSLSLPNNALTSTLSLTTSIFMPDWCDSLSRLSRLPLPPSLSSLPLSLTLSLAPFRRGFAAKSVSASVPDALGTCQARPPKSSYKRGGGQDVQEFTPSPGARSGSYLQLDGEYRRLPIRHRGVGVRLEVEANL